MIFRIVSEERATQFVALLPGCPEGSTLLGKQMCAVLSLREAPDALIGSS